MCFISISIVILYQSFCEFSMMYNFICNMCSKHHMRDVWVTKLPHACIFDVTLDPCMHGCLAEIERVLEIYLLNRYRSSRALVLCPSHCECSSPTEKTVRYAVSSYNASRLVAPSNAHHACTCTALKVAKATE